MKVQIKRIDTSLPLPEYKTTGAVGFDLYARKPMTIEAKGIGLVPNNIIVKTPKGYMFMLASRGSTPKKKGLMLANSVGIIDQDFCGPEDEVHTMFYNFTDLPVTIEQGERLSQGIFVRVDCAEWVEIEIVEDPTRGWLGSTGTH